MGPWVMINAGWYNMTPGGASLRHAAQAVRQSGERSVGSSARAN